MTGITTLAFDADDTLWHHENFFLEAKQRLHAVLNAYGTFPDALEQMDAQHIADIPTLGYGVKSHILSCIDVAIRMTDGKIPASGIASILQIGRELYQHPIILLDGVAETIAALHGRYRMLVITKGDLIAQEMKVTRSGLGHYFDAIEIVSEKDTDTYRKIMKRYNIKPESLIMIGNTLRSDILPPIQLGAQAIHIPYQTSWSFENAEIAESDAHKFIMVPSIRSIVPLMERLEKSGQSSLSALVEKAAV
jgi:putative hydrolase of the HAD superfamily